MEAIMMKNGKMLKPSCAKFLSSFGDNDNKLFCVDRGYISKHFYELPIEERLDIFEIYLEYFFRQMYYSYISEDKVLGEPRVDETRLSTEIRSSIENSSYDFMFYYGRFAFGYSGVREIYLAIVDNVESYVGYRANIGFTSFDIQSNNLSHKIQERMQLVFKSIITTNPEMATWYLLQGINIIEDATCELK